MELTGALAWYTLWRRRRERLEPQVLTGSVVVMSLLTLAVVTRAASIGGEIRHTEIQSVAEPTFAGPLARRVGDFVRDTPWAWTGAETVHFLGLTLLIGVVGLLALRLLGLARGLSTAAVDRLLPWGMLGFAVSTMTGMLFMAAQYSQYVASSAFYYKLVSILAAGAGIVYFTLDRSWLVRPDQDAPAVSRAMSAATFGLWLVVLFWGMMLPFIGTAF